MADRRQNRRNNSNKDEDYNPKFRKMRKKEKAIPERGLKKGL